MSMSCLCVHACRVHVHCASLHMYACGRVRMCVFSVRLCMSCRLCICVSNTNQHFNETWLARQEDRDISSRVTCERM